MTRWFEKVKNDPSNIVSSRVRLSRNWEEYKFPSRLEEDEARYMVGLMTQELKNLKETDGRRFECRTLEKMEELDRMELRERRLLNKTLMEKTTPGSIIYSEDEAVSLVLNGDDHIRLQVLAPGLMLKECYEEADRLDDYINEKFPYAFSSKYGYLTSYPTNVGTGMKASVVVHLPSLSTSKRFQELLGDMSRFGTTVRGVYGRGSENSGDLYEIYNQKTLGLNEQEIMELVSNVAVQLSGQEREVREASLAKHRLLREDEVYKSYGVLKYARKLSMKEAMTFLSHLRAGIADGLVETKEFVSIYNIMIGIQPANLQKYSRQPLGKDELEVARGRYIREHLPELK
ncbi:ATP--guanido phosphotransferase [[Clostridium] symbiosum]|uniref:ATP--guanido phosphotransferase n=1 Tax=Clostridium symbiosum TaxID=1512 RepID=UPI001D07B2C7|nr:ATP--guanido phosphotransferase [[Clostridium] symbiosum]MCB6607811.1 ATP--guanido phosphotransferase [[Clostridium] symbiosum]MCB6932672.1 ATP--guanido phosphotransferase [[Clostridium] symbiosum]